jgi:RimJ/RimL family protein N-acetyltransferase
MRHLAILGREAGLRELIAEVLSENVPMLNVFERSGLAMNTRRDGAVVHVTLRYP